jgi:tetratricopeptide (TPR) repeat protein
MKVKSGKSALLIRLFLPLSAFAFVLALMLWAPGVQLADANLHQQKPKLNTGKLNREAKKHIREGRYQEALTIYRELLDANAGDTQARLGASFIHYKLQEYIGCFEQAMEVLKTDSSNARAHALVGVTLLRSGIVAGAVNELQRAINLDGKEALAYGGAAEIDYYEGRPKEARVKSFYAHHLDPDEPDYLITYARASSRVEDFKEAADAYQLYLEVAPHNDTERRDRIHGLIQFYRQLSGLQVHQLSGPAITEAPFRLGADRRPYIRVKLNGRDALFVIDTGSGFTVLSKDAAKRFGVSEIARGGKSQGIGGTGQFPIIYGLIKSIQIGDARVRMIPCFIRPFHGNADRSAEDRADGFIGLSILSHFLTELDYKDSRIRLDRSENRSSPIASPGVALIPFRTTQNGLISVESEFDGNQHLNVILDSGASSTVISSAAVGRLKLTDQIIKGQTTSVVGAAGVSDNVQMLFLRQCRVADVQQSNLRALVLDFNAINETSGFEQSGILGGDFLRNFKLTIDFSRSLLALKLHTPTNDDHQ